jgi:hypothetical protein
MQQLNRDFTVPKLYDIIQRKNRNFHTLNCSKVTERAVEEPGKSG